MCFYVRSCYMLFIISYHIFKINTWSKRVFRCLLNIRQVQTEWRRGNDHHVPVVDRAEVTSRFFLFSFCPAICNIKYITSDGWKISVTSRGRHRPWQSASVTPDPYVRPLSLSVLITSPIKISGKNVSIKNKEVTQELNFLSHGKSRFGSLTSITEIQSLDVATLNSYTTVQSNQEMRLLLPCIVLCMTYISRIPPQGNFSSSRTRLRSPFPSFLSFPHYSHPRCPTQAQYSSARPQLKKLLSFQFLFSESTFPLQRNNSEVWFLDLHYSHCCKTISSFNWTHFLLSYVGLQETECTPD